MHEIVIVRSGYYPKGTKVGRQISEWTKDRLWWFDEGPFELPGEAMMVTQDGEATMLCEAAWFQFDFMPNLSASHVEPGSGYMADEFEHVKHFDLFMEDLSELAEIVRRKAVACEFFPETDFYALYDVELDEYRDDDGGLDSFDVIPTLLGELDMSKIELALVQKGSTDA